MTKLRHVVLALFVAHLPAMLAMAQTPPKPETEPEATPFNNVAELTEALTQPGRCPKGDTAAYMVACAVVKYIATDDPLDVIYRPIFRVVSAGGGELAAWTVNLGAGFQTKVKKVSMDEVFKDIRTSSPRSNGENKRYMPVDVFGFQDNQQACKKDKFSKACHSSPRVQTDPFERYRFELPTSEADKIWR